MNILHDKPALHIFGENIYYSALAGVNGKIPIRLQRHLEQVWVCH